MAVRLFILFFFPQWFCFYKPLTFFLHFLTTTTTTTTTTT